MLRREVFGIPCNDPVVRRTNCTHTCVRTARQQDTETPSCQRFRSKSCSGRKMRMTGWKLKSFYYCVQLLMMKSCCCCRWSTTCHPKPRDFDDPYRTAWVMESPKTILNKWLAVSSRFGLMMILAWWQEGTILCESRPRWCLLRYSYSSNSSFNWRGN